MYYLILSSVSSDGRIILSDLLLSVQICRRCQKRSNCRIARRNRRDYIHARHSHSISDLGTSHTTESTGADCNWYQKDSL